MGGIPVDLNAAEPMKIDLVQDSNWQDHHFAMTNWFYKYKWGDPAAQIAILAERGYDGVRIPRHLPGKRRGGRAGATYLPLLESGR
jgi:hypothetical protein